MRFIRALVIIAIAVPANAGPFSEIIAQAARELNVPAPPAPSDVCSNCNGSGKLGDGVVGVTCPVCHGTGRKPAGVVAVKAVAAPVSGDSYPLRKSWWNTGQKGRFVSNYRHLTEGQHAGKFDVAWLKTLDYYELNALHSDDHDGKVNWRFAKRAAGSEWASSGHWETRKVCHGTYCTYQKVWVTP